MAVSGKNNDKLAAEVRLDIIRQKTEDELNAHPVYSEFFAQFNRASVDTFIRNYALRKAFYLTSGADFTEPSTARTLRYRLIAEQALWTIQQKKLFNLQCYWRAEQIALRGIEHSSQFLLLSANIQYCPYISTVSRVEIDLYINFLKSGKASLNTDFYNWQDYESFKAACTGGPEDETICDGTSGHLPSWYAWYDQYMATGNLLHLPDLRGAKEKKYRSVARQHHLDKMKKNVHPQHIDTRPYLSTFDTEVMDSFIRRFEDKNTHRYFKAVEAFQEEINDQPELDKTFEKLKHAGKEICIRSNSDWRRALMQAAEEYELNQVAEMLPVVYEEYLSMVESGLNFNMNPLEKRRIEHAFNVCETARRQILEGRKLLGEPVNFLF